MDGAVLALERRHVILEERTDDGARLVQQCEALADRAERDPIRPVLAFVPSPAHAEDGSTSRHVVEGRGHLRQDGGVAVRDACDEHTQARSRRQRRDRRENGPAIEHWRCGVRRKRDEVVVRPEGVVSKLVHPHTRRADLLPRRPLWPQRDSKTQGRWHKRSIAFPTRARRRVAAWGSLVPSHEGR